MYLGNDERVEDTDDSKIPLLLHNEDGEPCFGRLRLSQFFLVSLKGFFKLECVPWHCCSIRETSFLALEHGQCNGFKTSLAVPFEIKFEVRLPRDCDVRLLSSFNHCKIHGQVITSTRLCPRHQFENI